MHCNPTYTLGNLSEKREVFNRLLLPAACQRIRFLALGFGSQAKGPRHRHPYTAYTAQGLQCRTHFNNTTLRPHPRPPGEIDRFSAHPGWKRQRALERAQCYAHQRDCSPRLEPRAAPRVFHPREATLLLGRRRLAGASRPSHQRAACRDCGSGRAVAAVRVRAGSRRRRRRRSVASLPRPCRPWPEPVRRRR